MAKKDKGFITITNKDIFKKLSEVADHVQEMNGSVKSNTINIKRIYWLIGILFMAAVTVIAAVK